MHQLVKMRETTSMLQYAPWTLSPGYNIENQHEYSFGIQDFWLSYPAVFCFAFHVSYIKEKYV